MATRLAVIMHTGSTQSNQACFLCSQPRVTFATDLSILGVGAALLANRKQNIGEALANRIRRGDLPPAFEVRPLFECQYMQKSSDAVPIYRGLLKKISQAVSRFPAPHDSIHCLAPRPRSLCSPRPHCPRKTKRYHHLQLEARAHVDLQTFLSGYCPA